MTGKLIAFVVALLVATEICAQKKTSDDLNKRTLERRAIEAVIWGKPAVNFERVLQAYYSPKKLGTGQFYLWQSRTNLAKPSTATKPTD